MIGITSPSVTLTAHPAKITRSLQPLYGPGTMYDPMQYSEPNDKTGKIAHKDIILHEGLEISVFFESDGWVFSEFQCELGPVRGRISVNDVE